MMIYLLSVARPSFFGRLLYEKAIWACVKCVDMCILRRWIAQDSIQYDRDYIYIVAFVYVSMYYVYG